MIHPLRWLVRNLGALLLAFIMAVIVWISAVTSADPNLSRSYVVPIEVIGQDPEMAILGEIPETAEITIFAPQSIIDQANRSNNAIRAWIDISDLEQGEHTIPLQIRVQDSLRPVRVQQVVPQNITLTLEKLVSKTLPILHEVRGQPALGYQAEQPEWSAEEVVISGRVSQVENVAVVEAVLDINGADETINTTITLRPLDSQGNLVKNVTLVPDKINVVQPITLLGGYRNVVVRVVTTGQVAEGYRTTNITPTPLNVLVFSDDPNLVEQLPGYIETEPLDLTGATDDIETILPLNLPEGVTVVGDSNVLVQVGVAALYSSVSISRQVEVIGIAPGFQALVSPEVVDVILYGPVPTLNQLSQVDVRVVVDVTDMEIGVHRVTPTVEILPEDIRKEALVPDMVEVVISQLETETPQANPEAAATPTLTPSPSPTP